MNPRSLLASLESIEAGGITLTEPLRTPDVGDQAADQAADQGESLRNSSNSRLALAAKTIGKYLADRQTGIDKQTMSSILRHKFPLHNIFF